MGAEMLVVFLVTFAKNAGKPTPSGKDAASEQWQRDCREWGHSLLVLGARHVR
jgi:hypothetical protein